MKNKLPPHYARLIEAFNKAQAKRTLQTKK